MARKNKQPFQASLNDITMNMALIFGVLFIIAFLMIQSKNNDVSKIDSVDTFLVTMNWIEATNFDMDIHVRNPEGEIINYYNEDKPWGTLERDDLGNSNDTQYVDNLPILFNYNREVVHLRNMIDGRYTVNVHFYANKEVADRKTFPQSIEVEFLQLEPEYKIVYKKKLTIELAEKEEYTVFSFDYVKGTSMTNVDTIEQVPFVVEELVRNPPTTYMPRESTSP